MDFRRILLFGSLGLVLAMIWQAWGVFQTQYEERQNGTASSVTSGVNGVNSDPGTSGNQGQANLAQDVPSAPAVPSGDATGDNGAVPPASGTVPTEQVNQQQSQLINVTTDLLKIQIDLHGGDIIRADLLDYAVSVDAPDQPFELMHRDPPVLYVAQSGLIGSDRDYPNHNVEFTADQFDFQLGDSESVMVKLGYTGEDGVQYTKSYTFHRNSYRIDVDFEVDNRSAQPWSGFFYGQLKETEIKQAGTMGFLGRLPSYSGAAIYTEQDKYDKVKYGDIQEAPLNITTNQGWVAMLQHYFVSAWLPEGSSSYQLYSGVSRNTTVPEFRIGYKNLEPVQVAAGATGNLGASLYIGPKEHDRLTKMDDVPGIALTIDYGWLTPVANPLFWLLIKIHSIVGNWGWAIILLTLTVKLIFLPLSAASYKSMAKMKKLQPRLKTLKERYGDDKQKFQQEMMKLYKTEKVNPAGGCLPILVQIPVFISLYWVLLESVELRQADFMLWLNDLSSPDPYYVLPIIMGISMLAQQLLNPAPMDPLQKKIMMALPVVFTVFFLWFPAGLVLYWVVNNLLSIAQQYFITKKYTSA